MAGEIPNLKVSVDFETGNVTVGVQKVKDGLANVTAEVEKSSSKMRELKDLMLGVFGGNLLTSGVMGLEKTLTDMNLAVQDAQVESNRLATALKNTGNATEANTQAVEANVKSYADLGFTHAQAAQAMGTLITATGNVAESTKLMSMAADLARYKHEDLNTAATTLARGTQGSVKAFKELGITLDSTLPKNEAIAKAFDELNGKIGGQATAYIHTFAGEVAVLKEKFNEIAVTLGNVVFPVITKVIGAFTDLFNAVKPFAPELLILTGVIGGAVVAYKAYQEVLAIGKGIQEAYTVATYLLGGAELSAVVATDAQTASMKALNFVINQNPFMKIVEVVTLVIGVMVELYRHNQDVRNIMITVAEAGVKGFGYIVGGVGEFIKALEYVVAGPLLLLLKGLSIIHAPGAKDAYNELSGAIKETGKWFDDTAHKVYDASNALDQYRKTSAIITDPNRDQYSGGDTTITGDVPGGNTSKAATAAAKAAAKKAADLKKSQDELTKLHTDYDTALKDRQDKMDAAQAAKNDRDTAAWDAFNKKIEDLQTKHDDAMQAAQDKFDQASADSHQAYQDKITQIDADFAAKKADLLTAYNDKITSLEQAAADKAVQLEQAAADKKQSIVQQSIDLLTNAWASATKIDVGSLFTKGSEATTLITSVSNGIVTSVVGAAKGTADGLKASLQEKLKEIQQLQQDAGKLAAAGYSQSFIQEVLAQGPQVGDQMAQSLLNAAPDTQASIQSLYGQIQDTSATGLDALATQMNSGAQLATEKLMDQYKQVDVTLQTELAKNAATLQDSISKENATYAAALDAATDAHTKATDAATATLNAALKKETEALTAAQEAANKAFSDGQVAAQNTLTTALKASGDTFDSQIKSIAASMDKTLSAMQTKITATAMAIVQLGGSASSSDFFFSAPAMAPTPYGPGITTTSPSAGSTGSPASTAPLGSSSPTSGGSGAQVSIKADIKVDGSTAPQDIQSALTNMTKFGLVAL